MTNETIKCPKCDAAKLRKERRKWWRKQPSPRLVALRMDRWEIAFSQIDASYERVGELLWYGRTTSRLASEFRFHVSIDQAREIIALNPNGTHVPLPIRELLFPNGKPSASSAHIRG